MNSPITFLKFLGNFSGNKPITYYGAIMEFPVIVEIITF